MTHIDKKFHCIYNGIRLSYEWDDRKNKVNANKHGVWFEEAVTVFTDENALEFFDEDHSHSEERFIRVGLSSSQARVLVVVYCERLEGKVIRIISARKATTREKHDYEKGI